MLVNWLNKERENGENTELELENKLKLAFKKAGLNIITSKINLTESKPAQEEQRSSLQRNNAIGPSEDIGNSGVRQNPTAQQKSTHSQVSQTKSKVPPGSSQIKAGSSTSTTKTGKQTAPRPVSKKDSKKEQPTKTVQGKQQAKTSGVSPTKVVTQKRSAQNEKLDEELKYDSSTETAKQIIAKLEDKIKASLDQPNQTVSMISAQNTSQDSNLQNIDSTIEGESSWDGTSNVHDSSNQDPKSETIPYILPNFCQSQHASGYKGNNQSVLENSVDYNETIPHEFGQNLVVDTINQQTVAATPMTSSMNEGILQGGNSSQNMMMWGAVNPGGHFPGLGPYPHSAAQPVRFFPPGYAPFPVPVQHGNMSFSQQWPAAQMAAYSNYYTVRPNTTTAHQPRQPNAFNAQQLSASHQSGSTQFETNDPIMDAKRKVNEKHPGIYGTTTDLSQNQRKSSDNIKREEMVRDRQSDQNFVITGKQMTLHARPSATTQSSNQRHAVQNREEMVHGRKRGQPGETDGSSMRSNTGRNQNEQSSTTETYV